MTLQVLFGLLSTSHVEFPSTNTISNAGIIIVMEFNLGKKPLVEGYLKDFMHIVGFCFCFGNRNI